MKNCFAKSTGALSLLLLAISLSPACKNSANVSNSNNGNAAATNTTTTTVTKNTTTTNANTEAPANKSTSATSSTAELHTPPDGSPERKAILDAVRDYLKSKESFEGAVFDEVEKLNVHQGWAYIATDISAADESPYGLVEALLQEQNGRWRVVEVFEYDGSTEKADWEAFKSRHADAPKDIFPPRG